MISRWRFCEYFPHDFSLEGIFGERRVVFGGCLDGLIADRA